MTIVQELKLTIQETSTKWAKHAIENYPYAARHLIENTPLHGSPDEIEPTTPKDVAIAPALEKANAGSQSLPLAAVVKAQKDFYSVIDPTEIQPWNWEFFEMVKPLQEAPRNFGKVLLMNDSSKNRLVAVKRMPNEWVCKSHSEFIVKYPTDTEMPWQDIGCVRFLNSVSYPYACSLEGLYRDQNNTYVVTSFASEGDLFQVCHSSEKPSLERERIMRPLVKQMLRAIHQLHELSVVHRDISLENILVSRDETNNELIIRIIDFGLASRQRIVEGTRGKASYQAPEMHKLNTYDGQAADVFSLGVTLFGLLLGDYPWSSTRLGQCQLFDYVCAHGLAACLAERKFRNQSPEGSMLKAMSPALVSLLGGMLAIDPAERLTLGEGTERSVWDEPWLTQDLEN